MTIKVLLNPYSNRWSAKKRWPEAESALKAAGVDFEMAVSERAGALYGLAAKAVDEGFDTVVIAGGDGSIGEVVNGLAQSWSPKSKFPANVGILPMGSANDLAYSVGLPLDLGQAARVIALGHTTHMDLGQCNERLFLNNSGAALEPYVTNKQERIPWIHGVTRYMLAAIWAILDKPEWQGSIHWDGGEYKGPLSLVSVGNGRRTGGFFMTPHADPFDGRLTLAFGYRPTRRGIFSALPRALKEDEGSYVNLPGMHEVHCSDAQIHFDKPSPAHTDGVLFNRWLTDLDYKIYPRVVPVLMP